MSACSWVVAGLLALAAVMVKKGDMLWCEARSIPLGVLLREKGFSLEELPDLRGKVALITGANTGLGFETARQLALANATVILACRDMGKCSAAARDINRTLEAQHALGSTRTVQINLEDLQQVATAADRLRQDLEVLDILVNNAGVATQFPFRLTIDGIESTFQVNYLGHFLLTLRLLPLLDAPNRKSPARIVHLSSGAHRGAPANGVLLSLEAINSPTAVGAYARYGMAKLANLVFSEELARRKPQLLSNAVHPGVVASDMLREANFVSMLGSHLGRAAFTLARARNAVFAYSTTEASVTLLHCAASSKLLKHNVSGAFYVPMAKQWPPHHPKAQDPAFAAELWNFSEALLSKALATARRNDTAA